MFDFLQGKLRCPHCSGRVRPNATLCPACGQTLIARKRSEQCPSCGARMTAHQAVCPICGAERQAPEGHSSGNAWKVLLSLAVLAAAGGAGLLLKPWAALMLMPATPTPILGVNTPLPLPLPSEEATELAMLIVTPSLTPPTPTLRPTATFTPSPTATPSPLPSATSTVTPTPEPIGTRIHTVASGDNLGSIAVEYDVAAASIASANNIKLTTMLRVGQELIIPAPTAGPTNPAPTEATTAPATSPATTAPTAAAITTPTTAATNAPTAGPTVGPVIHTVQSGDLLGSLAVKYGVDGEEIAKANNIRMTTTLRVGQELIIPGVTAAPTPLPPLKTPTTANTDIAVAAITGTKAITGSLVIEMTPTPRPTYEFDYLAPPLLAPVDRSVMLGTEANIVLNWASVGILSTNQWYMVTIWPSAYPANVHKEWTKATSWRVPLDLYPKEGDPIEYTWQVKVVQRFSETEDGVPLSPPSVTYHFTWKE